ACPRRAQRPGEGLTRNVAGFGERKDVLSAVSRDLHRNVGRGAEAIEPQPLARAGHRESTVADQSGAQQRRRFDVGIIARQPEAIARVRGRVFGVAAVDRVTGEARTVAEVFAPAAAVDARPAGPAEPWHADTVANGQLRHLDPDRLDGADDLMPRNKAG